jgi:hypothetical protein
MRINASGKYHQIPENSDILIISSHCKINICSLIPTLLSGHWTTRKYTANIYCNFL